MTKLRAFIRESNLIEGIERAPTDTEMEHARRFMGLPSIGLQDLNAIQATFAPGHRLRDQPGLDVRVGRYIAPAGGPDIRINLFGILDDAHTSLDPWKVHVAFEMLHPYTDGNGRTGRILWAWQMQRLDQLPFALPFLHRFYYQTLDASGS
jgi:hypothetical protein